MKSHRIGMGWLQLLTVSSLLAAACGRAPEPVQREETSAVEAGREVAVPEQAQKQVWQCKDSKRFTLRTLPDTVWLELPNRTVRLPRDNEASGTRFSNGDVDFSVENGSGRLETEEDTYIECRS